MTKEEKKLLFMGFLYATDPRRRATGAEGSEHAKIAWHVFVDPTPIEEASPEIRAKMRRALKGFNKALPNIIKDKDDKMLIDLGKKWKPSANEYTQRIQRTDGTTTKKRITVYQWELR